MSTLAIPYDVKTQEGLSAIAEAKYRFLEDPDTDLSRIRPAIARSWFRSTAAGIDPSARHDRFEEPRIDEQAVSAAAPHLRELEHLAVEAGGYVTLTAPNGALVIDSSISAEDRLPHGYVLLEDTCGTNSDGTALEEGHSVWVFSREHYREDMQDTCCFSALVRDPFRHHVRACIGLTLPESVAMASDPSSTALVLEGVAARITHELAVRTSVKEQALFAEYLTLSRRYGNAVLLAMDGKNNIASNAALELLREADYHVISGYAHAALQSGRPIKHAITLSGERTAFAEISPAGDPLNPAGAIVLIKLAEPRQTTLHRWMPALTAGHVDAGEAEGVFDGLVGCSSGFDRAVRLAQSAIDRHVPVHLIGERGVGKYELGMRIARAWGNDVVTIDGRQIQQVEDEELDALAMLRNSLETGTPVVLRSADMLPAGSVDQVMSLLEIHDEPRVVLTIRRPTSLTARLVQALGSSEIAVPPLRTRREDIPLLVDHFAAELGPKRPAARFHRVLTQAEWPGNISQLLSIVRQAVASARGAEVTVSDLPQTFQHGMTPGRLSRLEEAELYELRNALSEACGNRKLAADMLQIGRSTLYRRLDFYRRRGITL